MIFSSSKRPLRRFPCRVLATRKNCRNWLDGEKKLHVPSKSLFHREFHFAIYGEHHFPARSPPRHRGCLDGFESPDQLRFHLDYVVQNGVKKEELIEVIRHLAFCAG